MLHICHDFPCNLRSTNTYISCTRPKELTLLIQKTAASLLPNLTTASLSTTSEGPRFDSWLGGRAN